MYKIVALIGYFIRILYIPNPFESIKINDLVSFGPYLIPITSDVINVVVCGILGIIVYTIVGLLYNGNSVMGSVLYLIIYAIINVVIAGVCKVGISVLSVIVAIVIVMCSVCIINRLLDKIECLVNNI